MFLLRRCNIYEYVLRLFHARTYRRQAVALAQRGEYIFRGTEIQRGVPLAGDWQARPQACTIPPIGHGRRPQPLSDE